MSQLSDLDNIDDSTPLNYNVQIEPPYNNRMTLSDAAIEVSKHYGKNFKLQFIFPMQCVDGAIVEIRDTNTSTNSQLLATAKLRHSANELSYDRNSGNINMRIYLNDISFERKTINVSVNDPNNNN